MSFHRDDSSLFKNANFKCRGDTLYIVSSCKAEMTILLSVPTHLKLPLYFNLGNNKKNTRLNRSVTISEYQKFPNVIAIPFFSSPWKFGSVKRNNLTYFFFENFSLV